MRANLPEKPPRPTTFYLETLASLSRRLIEHRSQPTGSLTEWLWRLRSMSLTDRLSIAPHPFCNGRWLRCPRKREVWPSTFFHIKSHRQPTARMDVVGMELLNSFTVVYSTRQITHFRFLPDLTYITLNNLNDISIASVIIKIK